MRLAAVLPAGVAPLFGCDLLETVVCPATNIRQYARLDQASICADMGGRHSDLALYSGGQPGQAFYISTSTSVIAISGGPVKLGANRAIAAA